MGRGTTLGVYLKAISSSGSLLLLLLFHFQKGIIVGASAASVPPATEEKCDKVVSVGTVELLSYLGNVTFVVPKPFTGRWTTVIKFTSPYTFVGGWGVEVQSYGLKAYAIFTRFDEEELKAGDLVVFQFRVLYGYNAKVPKVHSIRWENMTICGPQSQSQPQSQKDQPIKIKDTLSLELDSSEEEEYGSRSQPVPQPQKNQPPKIKSAPLSAKLDSSEEDDDDDAVKMIESTKENVSNIFQRHIETNNVRLQNWKEPEVKS